MKTDTDNRKIILAFVLGCLLLIAPFTIRAIQHNIPFYGSHSAYTSRIAQNYTQYDSIQERQTTYNGFYTLFSALGIQTPLQLTISSFVLGILSLIFFYLIIKKHTTTPLTLFLLISSPIFIFIFSSFSPLTIIIFLNVVGFYIFTQRHAWLAFPFFAALPFIDIFSFFLSMILLWVYALHYRQNLRAFYIIFIIALLPALYILSTNVISITYPFDLQGYQNTLVEFGALQGISIPLLLLALLGLHHIWKNTRAQLLAYILFFVTLAIATFSSTIKIYFSFLLPYAAGYALDALIKRNWSIPLLKNTTFLLVFCSLLFPTVAFMQEASLQPPNQDMQEALHTLDMIASPNTTIVSSETNGFFIETYAHRKAFLDDISYQYPKYLQKKQALQTIWYARKLDNLTEILTAHNIEYFYIDTAMKQELWNNKEEGLLFLLHNSNAFTLRYQSPTVEIWQYVRPETIP